MNKLQAIDRIKELCANSGGWCHQLVGLDEFPSSDIVEKLAQITYFSEARTERQDFIASHGLSHQDLLIGALHGPHGVVGQQVLALNARVRKAAVVFNTSDLIADFMVGSEPDFGPEGA